MKTDHENYKILRGTHIVFVLRESETGSAFIALPGNTSDADILRIAQATHSNDWQKLETINFDSVQSNPVPDSGNQR